MTDFRNNPLATARGIRNNNPFNMVKTNIKWQGKVAGTDSKFETFATIEQGIRAGIIDIVGDISKDGKNTIKKLITVFAPPTENDTLHYISTMVKATGVSPDSVLNPNGKLDPNFLNKLALGIIIHENGNNSKIIPTTAIVSGVNSAITSANIKKYINIPAGGILPSNGTINDLGAAVFIGLFLIILLKTYFKY